MNYVKAISPMMVVHHLYYDPRIKKDVDAFWKLTDMGYVMSESGKTPSSMSIHEVFTAIKRGDENKNRSFREDVKEMVESIEKTIHPMTKEEAVNLYVDFLRLASKETGNILEMVRKGEHLTERCDNRIYDAILYLMSAKNILK